MGYAERQNAAAQAAKKRHTTAFKGVGPDGRKASRRPRGKGSRPVRLNLALSKQEVALYRKHAKAAGMSLSYWIVSAANAYAGIHEGTARVPAGVSHPVAEDRTGQMYLAEQTEESPTELA